MPKNRIEGLSDKIFVILLTLLIIKIKFPETSIGSAISNEELWAEVIKLSPLFLAYLVSFAVIATFWVFHSSFYSIFTNAKTDRVLAQLNTVFLAMIGFIPFSADLIRIYTNNSLAIALYGFNVLLVAIAARVMLSWARKSEVVEKQIQTDSEEAITFKKQYGQASFRSWVNVISSITGIALAFVSPPLAYLCFALPIFFNIIPGLVNKIRGAKESQQSNQSEATPVTKTIQQQA